MSQWNCDLSNWSEQDLESCYTRLGAAALELRALNQYAVASQLKAMQQIVNQQLMVVLARRRQSQGRQLSLAPPPTYE